MNLECDYVGPRCQSCFAPQSDSFRLSTIMADMVRGDEKYYWVIAELIEVCDQCISNWWGPGAIVRYAPCSQFLRS